MGARSEKCFRNDPFDVPYRMIILIMITYMLTYGIYPYNSSYHMKDKKYNKIIRPINNTGLSLKLSL